MPKSTFYRISEEKQNRILEAAKHELLSYPYSEISINRIIKKAEIPRGSFYQYFDGKDDLFQFVLQDYKKNLIEIVSKEMDICQGDLFLVLKRGVHPLVEYVYHAHHGGVRMIFSEPWAFEDIWKEMMKNKVCKDTFPCGVIDKIDRNLLDIENEEELYVLISILGMVLRDSICMVSLDSEAEEEQKVKEQLMAKISTLERHFRSK